MSNEIIYVLLLDYAAHEAVYLSQAIASDEFALKESPKYVNKVVAPTLEPVKSIGSFRTLPDYSFETMPADYAFILHMIYHLNEGGTMACVAPHGVLFRGNAEGVIRRFLIEKKNYVDAIIGLPANIFYGTSIPTCILVLKKCRKEDDNILFIDASKEFEKVKKQNKLREQHIRKIVETYRNRKEIEKYSHLATLKEVADNDYNLNIPRYINTFEEEEPIDIKAVMAEIKELETKRAELDKEIEVYLKELGIV